MAESDEILKAPYFWNGDVMPLCTRAVIDRRTDLVKSIYTDPPGPGVVEP